MLAKGLRPHQVTVWRWSAKGVGGIKLRVEKVGRRIYTTVDWVNEFVDATTGNWTNKKQDEFNPSESKDLTARQKKASETVKAMV